MEMLSTSHEFSGRRRLLRAVGWWDLPVSVILLSDCKNNQAGTTK
jgi:hypothetical protein